MHAKSHFFPAWLGVEPQPFRGHAPHALANVLVHRATRAEGQITVTKLHKCAAALKSSTVKQACLEVSLNIDKELSMRVAGRVYQAAEQA